MGAEVFELKTFLANVKNNAMRSLPQWHQKKKTVKKYSMSHQKPLHWMN